ncbi:MAG: HD domain-containing protein [Methanomicrobiales archaeon]
METPLEQTRTHARNQLGNAGSHGMDHTELVTRLCRIIGNSEDADMDIFIPAALLHDIARPCEKEHRLPHEEKGAQMAETFLVSIHYNALLIPAICAAIRTHRFRSNKHPERLEAVILSGADKLDDLEAVGSARTVMRAAGHGGSMDDAVQHFHDKLLKLKDCMYTHAMREIAREPHAFLERFLAALAEETGNSFP